MKGFVNVLKPPGMTSHDVIDWMRKKLGVKRIGHAGTLDPDVAGVLVVAVGQATRLLEYLMDQPKKYRCEIILGLTTDTQDLSGKVLATRKVPSDYLNQFSKIISRFIGEIKQIPPMVSAVRHKGKRLYELAREGVTVERKARLIKIYSISIVELEQQDEPKILFDVHCSKGTYVRTLCHDIGEALGCGGTMSYLLRTASGSFNIEDAWTLEEISEAIKHSSFDFLLPYDHALQGMPSVVVDGKTARNVLNGVPIKARDILSFQGDFKLSKPICVYSESGDFLAMGVWQGSGVNKTIKLRKVFKEEV